MHDVDLPPSPKQSEWIWFFTVGGTAASVSSKCSQKQPHDAHLIWTNLIFLCGVFALR